MPDLTSLMPPMVTAAAILHTKSSARRRMIAVDTNILVYAHRGDAPFHERAAASIADLASGTAPWAIPWPCLHEFFGIVTRPRIFDPPSSLDEAIAQIEARLEAPSLMLISETPQHWPILRELIINGRIDWRPRT